MLKSVPYLAALLSSVLLICLSAHADTLGLSAVARALADPRNNWRIARRKKWPASGCLNTIQAMPTCRS
jgi:hypothetical protein